MKKRGKNERQDFWPFSGKEIKPMAYYGIKTNAFSNSRLFGPNFFILLPKNLHLQAKIAEKVKKISFSTFGQF